MTDEVKYKQLPREVPFTENETLKMQNIKLAQDANQLKYDKVELLYQKSKDQLKSEENTLVLSIAERVGIEDAKELECYQLTPGYSKMVLHEGKFNTLVKQRLAKKLQSPSNVETVNEVEVVNEAEPVNEDAKFINSIENKESESEPPENKPSEAPTNINSKGPN